MNGLLDIAPLCQHNKESTVVMLILRIKNWDDHFENNRSREVKVCNWVPTPNSHDGDGYTMLVDHKDAAAHFGCWNALIQIASRCSPRGTLLRKNGAPHTAKTLARMARLPFAPFDALIKRLIKTDIDWLEIIDENGVTQEDMPPDAALAALGCEITARGCLEGKKGKKEEKGKKDIVFPANLDNSKFKKQWDEWEKYKREKGKKLTQSTIKKQLASCSKYGAESACKAIEKAIFMGWAGLFPKSDGEAALETDATILDYAKQYLNIAGSWKDDERLRFEQKVKDNCGLNGASRVRAAAKQIRKAAN